jgi:drug/metabolite transporter (DMT)-like permease
VLTPPASQFWRDRSRHRPFLLGCAVETVCYVLATRAGLFGLAVVLTSLYPGVTVLLARIVLGARMRWVQRAGLLLAAGIILVTA